MTSTCLEELFGRFFSLEIQIYIFFRTSIERFRLMVSKPISRCAEKHFSRMFVCEKLLKYIDIFSEFEQRFFAGVLRTDFYVSGRKLSAKFTQCPFFAERYVR